MSNIAARLNFPLPWRIVPVLLVAGLGLVWEGWWQGTAAGPQVQVPMFYDAHYLFPRPWTQEQEAPGVPPPARVSALYGPNRISQSFVNGTDRLSMLRVWLAGPAGTPVEVALQTDDGRAYAAKVTLESKNGRHYYLTLPTLTGARDRRFLLTLSAPQASIDQPVSTLSVGGDRLGGSAYVNEFPRPGNILLATYGQGPPGLWWLGHIGEQLLPGVFALRLQQYRIQPFKGAVFTVLLAITILFSFGLLVLAGPGSMKGSHWSGWAVVVFICAFFAFELLTGRLLLPPFTDAESLTATDQDIRLAPGPDQPLRLVHDLPLTLWTARREPEARFVRVVSDDENRSAIEVPASSAVDYFLAVPPNSNLRVGISSLADSPVRFTVRLGDETIAAQEYAAAQEILWLDLDLSPWAGQTRPVRLITEATTADQEARALWVMPQIRADATWLLAPPLDAHPGVALVSYEFSPAGSDQSLFLGGYRLEPDHPRAGEIFTVTLYWYTTDRMDHYATVFVHLLDETGAIQVQDDSQPVTNAYPVPAWQPETIVADTHTLIIPDQFQAESPQLAVGLYAPDTRARWTALGSGGNRLPEDLILLSVPAPAEESS